MMTTPAEGRLPLLGSTVYYVLSKEDAANINRRRTSPAGVKHNMELRNWPRGAQAHIGNPVKAGEICSARIVKAFGEHYPLNLQVYLDGSDVLWVASVPYSARVKEGTWHWMPQECVT